MKTPPRTPDTKVPANESGASAAFSRIAERVAGVPARDEARRRIRGKPGFFASLTPEARELIRNHDGPEVIGPGAPRKR
jgi:hypothetical protein